MVETRPALDNIPDAQRVLALAHWYTWRLSHEQNLVELLPSLHVIEIHLQPETAHRLAMARRRYWREVPTENR